MTKSAILAAVAVTLVTAVAVPAALLSGGTSSNEVTEGEDIERTVPEQASLKTKSKTFTKPSWSGKLIPRIASAKWNRPWYKEVGCLKNHYGLVILRNRGLVDTEFKSIDDFSNNSESCLIVEYYKQTYKSGKWWGEFRLIWSVKDEKQGLITVTTARTDRGNLRGSSAAYAIKKDKHGEFWTTYYTKEIVESKKKEEGLKNLIPQASSSIPGALENYWGFNPTLGNICGVNDCVETSGEATHNYYSWEFTKEDGKNEVYSWNTDTKNWLKVIFGWENFERKISKIKGTWNQKENQ